MREERHETQLINGHRIATAFHDGGGTDVVVFCHGFKGVKTGPSRYFVRAARLLAERGISSLRFDQYGSGDSEGEFEDSSFDDWITTTRAIVEAHLAAGSRVALFGQSMGGCASIAVAAAVPEIVALVAWSPGANIEPFVPSPTGLMEEEGQIVRDGYWKEAHEARIGDRFAQVSCPAYVVLGTADHLADESNRRAFIDKAQPHHRIEVIEGLAHSAWSATQAKEIVGRSCEFLATILQSTPAD
jgi:alpha-beta hydrolase superfamily lysophospholipase